MLPDAGRLLPDRTQLIFPLSPPTYPTMLTTNSPTMLTTTWPGSPTWLGSRIWEERLCLLGLVTQTRLLDLDTQIGWAHGWGYSDWILGLPTRFGWVAQLGYSAELIDCSASILDWAGRSHCLEALLSAATHQ